jgi:hypothetical protein
MNGKRMTHVKVHAWGKGFNDSVDMHVRKNLVLYNISVSFPRREEEQDVAFGVTEHEIFSEIMESLAYAYRNYQVEQINLTFDYEEE